MVSVEPPAPRAAVRRPPWNMVTRLGRTTWLLPASVRRFVRSREIGLTMFAAVVGVAAAALVDLMGALANEAHYLLYGLRAGDRLSGIASFSNPFLALWPVAGGAVLCAMNWLGARVGRTNVVDPIEANALRGGRMSFRDSALLALQTLVSNGFGASVGLEAGYTQLGSGLASRAGAWMHLRREDMRIIVGCGAAGAIAAAFDGPLTGAFYAFELVLARYAIGYVAPVMAASISATLATHAFGGAPFHITVVAGPTVRAWDIPLFILLGVACAVIGILWMRAVPVCERLFKATGLPRRRLSDDALATLQVRAWPGNLRQLRNNVERMLILASGDPSQPITAEMLPAEPTLNEQNAAMGAERIIALPLREAREVFEREYLNAQMMRFSGNISRTAAFIGMERSALHRKLKSLGLSGARPMEEEEA